WGFLEFWPRDENLIVSIGWKKGSIYILFYATAAIRSSSDLFGDSVSTWPSLYVFRSSPVKLKPGLFVLLNTTSLIDLSIVSILPRSDRTLSMNALILAANSS